VRSSQVSKPFAKVRMRKRSVPPVNNCQRFMLAVGPSVRIRSPVAVVLRGLPKNPVYDSMKFYFICSGKFFLRAKIRRILRHLVSAETNFCSANQTHGF
jgi:hypothetical protein